MGTDKNGVSKDVPEHTDLCQGGPIEGYEYLLDVENGKDDKIKFEDATLTGAKEGTSNPLKPCVFTSDNNDDPGYLTCAGKRFKCEKDFKDKDKEQDCGKGDTVKPLHFCFMGPANEEKLDN